MNETNELKIPMEKNHILNFFGHIVRMYLVSYYQSIQYFIYIDVTVDKIDIRFNRVVIFISNSKV